VGSEFVDECMKARAKYLPMELNPSLSAEEKQKSMKEWWNLVQSLIKRISPTKTMIRVI